MKNLFLIIVFFFCAFMANAQIEVYNNGNVGVKTTSTATKELTVQGNLLINAQSTPNWERTIETKVSTPETRNYLLNYNGEQVFYVCGLGVMYCKQGGWFGSDIKLKENITDIKSPLTRLMELKGVKYRYKKENGKTTEKDDRLGLIAQDVQKVFPEVVSEMDDGNLAIAYTDLIGVLVESIKEQQAQIESMQKEIEKLSKKQ